MTNHTERPEAFKADILEILLALSHGALHGYGIVQAVEGRTDGRISLAPSLLYRRLHRLADEGWVEQVGVERGARGKARLLYQLTPEGRRFLRAEAARLVALANSPDLLGALAPRTAEDG